MLPCTSVSSSKRESLSPLSSQSGCLPYAWLQISYHSNLFFYCSLIPPQMRRAAKDAGLIGTPGSGMNSGIGSPASFEVLQQISRQLSHAGPQQYFAKFLTYFVFLNQKSEKVLFYCWGLSRLMCHLSYS